MFKRSIFVLVLLIGLFVLSLPAQAATNFTGIGILSVIDTEGDCGATPYVQNPQQGLYFKYEEYVTYQRNDLNTMVGTVEGDSVGLIFRDGDGNLIGYRNGVVIGPGNYSVSVGDDFVEVNFAHPAYPAVSAPASRPWTVEAYDTTEFDLLPPDIWSRPYIGTVIFDPSVLGPACAALPIRTPALSSALNTGVSELDVQMFNATDDNGDATLHIYTVDDEGDGVLALEITQDIIAPYIDNPPSENTQLLTSADGKVTLYILDTGELQINSGPDSEGKIHVLIFDGIPPTNIYGYVIDPPLSS